MTIREIDAATANEWLNNHTALLVDVREPAEYAAEHIDGATLVPLSRLEAQAIPSPQGRKIIIHCRKGMRGQNACAQLQARLQNADIVNLRGGIEAWMAAGLPVVRGDKRILPLDRQVQLAIGLILLSASAAGWLGHATMFFVTGFIGLGLIMAGTTGFCGLARLLARMPWNKA